MINRAVKFTSHCFQSILAWSIYLIYLQLEVFHKSSPHEGNSVQISQKPAFRPSSPSMQSCLSVCWHAWFLVWLVGMSLRIGRKDPVFRECKLCMDLSGEWKGMWEMINWSGDPGKFQPDEDTLCIKYRGKPMFPMGKSKQKDVDLTALGKICV